MCDGGAAMSGTRDNGLSVTRGAPPASSARSRHATLSPKAVRILMIAGYLASGGPSIADPLAVVPSDATASTKGATRASRMSSEQVERYRHLLSQLENGARQERIDAIRALSLQEPRIRKVVELLRQIAFTADSEAERDAARSALERMQLALGSDPRADRSGSPRWRHFMQDLLLDLQTEKHPSTTPTRAGRHVELDQMIDDYPRDPHERSVEDSSLSDAP